MSESLTQGAIVALGVAAIALSVLLDDHEALAVTFGFAGIATAVFGLVLPQLDDEFEITTKGIKGKLRRARDVLASDALTLEDKGESLIQLFLPEPKPDAGGTVKGVVSIPPFAWPEDAPPGAVSLAHVGRDFEGHVRRAFEAEGWEVRRAERRRFDELVVERDGDNYLVELKVARHLSAADIEVLTRRVAEEAHDQRKWMLVAPERALTATALRLALETDDLELVSVPIVGDGHE